VKQGAVAKRALVKLAVPSLFNDVPCKRELDLLIRKVSPAGLDRLPAIRTAKNILWENIPPTHLLVAGITVRRIRELVHSPSVQSALERSSDTVLTFALRAVGQVVANQSQSDREIINRLWDILDDPYLSQAMGIAQNFRMMPGPKRR
jgi:hypothetical protein